QARQLGTLARSGLVGPGMPGARGIVRAGDGVAADIGSAKNAEGGLQADRSAVAQTGRRSKPSLHAHHEDIALIVIERHIRAIARMHVLRSNNQISTGPLAYVP